MRLVVAKCKYSSFSIEQNDYKLKEAYFGVWTVSATETG